MSELTDEEKARHRRAAEAIVHHVRWLRPALALDVAHALVELGAFHGPVARELERQARALVVELSPGPPRPEA